MRVLALLKHRYTPLIRECWGFDCMYNGGDGKAWGDWARNNPNAKLYTYYRNTRGGGTREESEILQCYNLSNVTVVPLHPEKISADQVLVSCPGVPLQPGRISHEQVPITYWRSRIQGAPFLLKR